uniref:RdRp n=1 Tax=viral metagenome TaxID=1070528 RepID=A0A2V0RI02_9ZZZZ
MQQINLSGKSRRVRVGPSFRKIVNSFFEADIENISNHYEKIANAYMVSNGPRWTATRLKAYYDFATRLVLELDTKAIPFCRMNRNGIPRDLLPMIPFLKSSNIRNRRACLTLLRSYTQIYCQVSDDTTTITNQNSAERTLGEFEQYFDIIIARYKYFLKPFINDESMFQTSKKGPNGPALLNLDKDLKSIESNGILQTIMQMHEAVEKVKVGQSKLEVSLKQDLYPELDLLVFETDRLKSDPRPVRKQGVIDHVRTMSEHAIRFEPNRYNKCIDSKISFIAEGGCKTRVIAIGDYFTQDALKPLHKSLYRCLNKLKTDGTSSHNRISKLVKSKTALGGYVSSFDLTSSTDRFPIFIQERVLSGLYNPEISSLWRKLMVDRDFSVGKSSIRYSVGQPMGLLSSWAAFALTHHITIEALALKVGKPSFKDYCIIGDDVTIFDSEVSKEYRRFLNHFEIQISESKSLESWGNPCSAEIGKRLFLNGQEVSPIPRDAIESAVNNYLLVPNLIKVAFERGIVSNNLPQPVQDVWSEVFPKGNKSDKIRTLIFYPLSEPQFKGNSEIWRNFSVHLVKGAFDEIKLAYVKKRAQSLYMNELNNIPNMGTLGLVLESEENPDISRHPFMSLLREYRGVCGSIFIGISTKGLECSDLEKLPYLVNPMVPSFVRRSHQIEKVRSSLILKTFEKLNIESKES